MFPVLVKWKWKFCMSMMPAISLLAFWSTQILVDPLFPYLMNTSQLTWQCIHITVMRETGTGITKEYLLIASCNLLVWKEAFISEFVLQIMAFWVVTLCTVVVGYQRFGGPCYLHLHPENGGSKVLRNTGVLPHYYMALQPRRLQLESSLPWKPQVLHELVLFNYICICGTERLYILCRRCIVWSVMVRLCLSIY
jgi:hypothetical protein